MMKCVRTPDGRATHGIRTEQRIHQRIVMDTYCGLRSTHDRLSSVRMAVDCKSCLAAMKKEDTDDRST